MADQFKIIFNSYSAEQFVELPFGARLRTTGHFNVTFERYDSNGNLAFRSTLGLNVPQQFHGSRSNLWQDGILDPTYPHNTGAIVRDVASNQEVSNDHRQRRAVAQFPEDGDGIREAVRNGGRLPQVLDRGALGR